MFKALLLLQAGAALPVLETPYPLPPPPGPHAAVPRGHAADWVTEEDYPAEALKDRAAGQTRFVLTIDTAGRVADCRITGSSGSAVLDSTACPILSRRARFQPAVDKAGRPVVGSFASVIAWRPPSTQPPAVPGVLSYNYVVDEKGNVSGCTLAKAQGVQSGTRYRLRNMSLCPLHLDRPYTDIHGHAVARKVTIYQSVVVEAVP